MAKSKSDGMPDQPTNGVTWLTMEQAADRAHKAQATIRSALRKHPLFADGAGFQEIKPILRLPDGTELPGSGRGNLLVRSDLLDQWAAVSGERQPSRASGTVYRLTLSGVPMSAEMIHGVAHAMAGITEGQPLHEAVAALLDPLDVDLRRAFTGRKSTASGSPESDTSSLEELIAPGTPAEQFEFELVEG